MRRAGLANWSSTTERQSVTGLDTNVLVRFFAQDDAEQSRRVDEFMQSLTAERPGFISVVVLAEMIWVLRGSYRASKGQVIDCVNRLLNSPEMVLEGETAIAHAVKLFRNRKADFTDCLIERSCHLAGCGSTVTFDRDAARFAGMRLL